MHDELDLPLGTVRVKAGGGLAGHNGLRSIKAHLHSDAFTRVRIGIGKPPGGKEYGADHVLHGRRRAGTAPNCRSASRWPPTPWSASSAPASRPPKTGSMGEVAPDTKLSRTCRRPRRRPGAPPAAATQR